MAYMRTVRTGSGATAVQIVHGSRRGARDIEHLGSVHDEQGVEALKAVARRRLAGRQGELELGLDAAAVAAAGPGPLQIESSQMAPLWEALCAAYDQLGLGEAVDGDEVFRQPVLARIIEPTSKQDSLRVLAEAGIDAVSYATLKRRLQGYADDQWQRKLAAACAAHARLGPASLVLYDVSTLYFDADAGDGFREPGLSKHDLAARPIYHYKRASIEAHLTIVFAALAVSRFVEDRTGWSIRKFVHTARRYRTVQIRAGAQLLTAHDPIPEDLRDALGRISGSGGAH